MSIQTPRTVFNDFTVRYKTQFYQIGPHQKVRVYPKCIFTCLKYHPFVVAPFMGQCRDCPINRATTLDGSRILELSEYAVYPKAKVLLQERLDGSIHLVFKGRYLTHQAIAKPAGPLARIKRKTEPRVIRVTPYIPPKDHPWKKYPIKPIPVAAEANMAALNAQ